MLHLISGITSASHRDGNLKVGGVIASVALAITAAGIFSWKQNSISLKSGLFTNGVIKNILKTSFRQNSATTSLDSKSGEILGKSDAVGNGVVLEEKNGHVKVHVTNGKKESNGFSDVKLGVKDVKKEVVCGKEGVERLWSVSEKDNRRLVDGNDSVGYVAWNWSDHVFVYPGTGGKKYFGDGVKEWMENRDDGGVEEKIVKVLETRIGAGDVILGASLTDSLVSALLPSESLSYMLPSIQRIVGYKKPVVFHVNSRVITPNHSVQSDYSSVFTAGTTGISVLGSTNAQEIHDFAVIAHLAALRSGTPFLHFFDGANVAHKTSTIRLLPKSYQSLIRKQESHKLNNATSGLLGIVDSVMNDLASDLGKRYHPVEYVGHPAAERVLVSLGGSASVIEEYVRASNEHIGVVIVHLIKPWSTDYFWSKVPASVKVLAVLDQDKSALPGWGPLYREILASVSYRPLVRVIGGSVQNNPDYNSIKTLYDDLSKNPVHGFSLSRDDNSNSKPFPSRLRQISFWDNDDSVVSPVPSIAKALASKYNYVDYANYYDTYCVKGVSNTILRFGTENVSPNGKHYAVVCLNDKFITEYDMLNSIEDGGIFILNMKEQPNFPAAIKRDIVRRKIKFFGIDTNGIAVQFSDQVNDLHAISTAIQAIVISQCTELHVDSLISKEWNPNPKVVAAAIKSIRVIEPSDDWLDSQDDVEQPLPTAVSGSILPQSAFYEKKKAKKNYLTSISNAATFLTFQNIYHTKIDIRSVGASHGAIYRTKLTKWLRLTPLDYDRNIFHMEIDIKGTGLKYDMGEALAVYGLNPTQQVANFLDFYNLQPNDIICIGQTHSGEYSVRTIFQLFQQYLDIFGRPSKKFYQALAGFAKNPQEKEKLEYIISDKGQEEFKIRVKETITFEDLLREFPSAKPTVEELIELIPPIKPRHYSIASSMKMHPDSVHLLVVTDDWTTPSGKYRVGQCSGYLAGLTNPETEDIYLTVSVAPSLMKLPPKNTQPVVMAGLGTGMAPFRAFIQERQYLLQQGEKVGPMALYFGSRFRAQEYLYGEELEAYHASGLLTYLRLAFSRDQKDKVYIQHKLGSDKSEICSLLLENKGHFYLCGPTWPAGDVYDAIVANFMAGGMTKEEAQETVYKMKEEGRYVLEVY